MEIPDTALLENPNKILSMEEIDALLEVVEENSEENEDEELIHQVTLYDFKRPNRIQRKNLRLFKKYFDKIAVKFRKEMAFNLGEEVEVQLHSTDELLVGEFLMSIPVPTFFAVVETNFGEMYLEMNPSIFMNKLNFDNNDLKPIDLEFMKKYAEIFLNEFNKELDLNAKIKEFESSSSYFDFNQNEHCLMAVYEMVSGHNSGMFNIAMPYPIIKEMLNQFKDEEPTENDIDLNIKTQIVGDCGSMSVSQIKALKVGEIIPIKRICLRAGKYVAELDRHLKVQEIL